jgi:DNA helicase II / ATP-dependent DNA helicase PcrA
MSSFDESDAFEGAVLPLSQQAMAARPSPYMDGLNPEQRRAVEALDGPVLMLAGAGTGKTKALTTRIAHLLTIGRARPNEILAVTFTNKAAREMKNRVGGLLGQTVEGMPWMGTFHSICVKLLRRHAELAGLKSNFTILDTDDQIRLLKQLIRAENIDDKRWPARMLAHLIDNWKNRAWTPDKVPNSEASAYNNRGTEIYEAYQERLKTLNAVDFGDLLLHVVTIFQDHPDVLAKYQNWFRFILVDEYQDTNVAQYLWLRLLAAEHKNICCVGDDDQSIYGWRGAEVGNILRFEKDFPGAAVIRLEQNYRSTHHILAAASGVIDGNEDRLGKTLWTDADIDRSKKVQLIGHWDGEEEARWIADKIEDHRAGQSDEARNRYNPRLKSFEQELDRRAKAGLGHISKHDYIRAAFESGQVYSDLKTHNLVLELLEGDLKSENMLKSVRAVKIQQFTLNEIVILVRASHQMRAFEDRFLTTGLPYRVIGGPRFYERLEIRDAMAYFRVTVSPDDDLAFERVFNTPKRGLGDKALQQVTFSARSNGVGLLEGLRISLEDGSLGARYRKAAGQLLASFDRWRMVARQGDNHLELAEMILEESGYTDHWKNEKTPEAPGRLENLKELVKALEQFENLQGFLEHVSLIMENEQEDAVEKVSIMTLHAAKGLEFPAVFLPGWEDGLFPSQRSMDETGLKGLEEERRLAYVGITRAEEICTISFAANRRIFGQWQSALPSRFIDELPTEHVEVLTPPGLYGGGFGAAATPGTDGVVRGSGLEERAIKADVYNSPGWKRMSERSAQRGMSQPREARNVVIDLEAVSSFGIGDRVFHQKFGYGAIVAIEGEKLSVAFEKAGEKKVIASFVTGTDDVPF